MDSADSKTRHPNTTARLKRNNCQKIGHFPRVCRTKPNKTKKVNNLEDMTSEENNEESEPEEILQITKNNKILPDNNDHYGVEMKINEKNRSLLLTPALRSLSRQTIPHYTTQKKSNR